MSELRFGSLCLISINESTRPFALFMLLGCMVLWWWLAQFNYGFLFRKPLCLFVRPSLMIAELIIVTRIPYLSLYRPLSHPFSIISFSSWGTLVHSTVFHYRRASESFHILPAFSASFLGLMHWFLFGAVFLRCSDQKFSGQHEYTVDGFIALKKLSCSVFLIISNVLMLLFWLRLEAAAFRELATMTPRFSF